MTDIKIFRLTDSNALELRATRAALEKHVQQLFERHMDSLLGVRFLASEYSTGKKHPGRVDSLGLDENAAPVIVEYKLHQNENVITQALYYLDWLLDHKADFERLAKPKLRSQEEVDWSAPRVMCIAEDFTRYDVYAVEQMTKNIELIRYRLYPELLLLELVNQPSAAPAMRRDLAEKSPGLARGPLVQTLETRILALGDDVRREPRKHHLAFRRIKNFACIVPQQKAALVYLNLDPGKVPPQPGFTRDVTNIGHWGTGDLELRLQSIADIERAMPLVQRSYEGS